MLHKNRVCEAVYGDLGLTAGTQSVELRKFKRDDDFTGSPRKLRFGQGRTERWQAEQRDDAKDKGDHQGFHKGEACLKFMIPPFRCAEAFLLESQ